MRLPKNQVVIAGHTIPILYKEVLKFDGADSWGYYDDNKHTIYLKKGMDKNHRAEVLLHECIHAIEFIHNFGLTEKAVNLLGIEILALIRNNNIDWRGK